MKSKQAINTEIIKKRNTCILNYLLKLIIHFEMT
jgi:hypothetical protein